MSWELVIGIEWPKPGIIHGEKVVDLEALIREVVDPLHRENVIVNGVRLEQVTFDG